MLLGVVTARSSRLDDLLLSKYLGTYMLHVMCAVLDNGTCSAMPCLAFHCIYSHAVLRAG